MKHNSMRVCLGLWVGILAAWPAGGRAEEPPTDAQSAVVRAVFARAIAEREPQDVISSLTGGAENVFFFSELRGLEGKTVKHRWEYEGKVMAEVPFVVRADHWRVYSSKRLLPTWGGTWTVSVVDENGQQLQSATLRYTPEPVGPTPQLPASPEEDPAPDTPRH